MPFRWIGRRLGYVNIAWNSTSVRSIFSQYSAKNNRIMSVAIVIMMMTEDDSVDDTVSVKCIDTSPCVKLRGRTIAAAAHLEMPSSWSVNNSTTNTTTTDSAGNYHTCSCSTVVVVVLVVVVVATVATALIRSVVLMTEIAKTLLKARYFAFQGGSRLLMFVLLESLSAVLVMMNKSLPICDRSHTRRVNSGKIIILGGTLFWRSQSFDGNLVIQQHKIWSQPTRNGTLTYGENPELLSYLSVNPYLAVRREKRTDGHGQTDGRLYRHP